jgi:2-oxo-3-hexenedioate decarboxylase
MEAVVSNINIRQLALELLRARSKGEMVEQPPSKRDPDFDMTTAYAVEWELARLRREHGRTTVGRKVGFANKALWRKLKLETLVWGHMYDDTVHFTGSHPATLSIATMCSPQIEPEIVFKLKQPLETGHADPAVILSAVQWLALGFEIIDCPFPNWQFEPVDFVAAFGFHAALVIGEPQPVQPDQIAMLVDQLPSFKLRLFKDEQLVEEGSGRNSLRSPALCLGELADAIARRPGATPLMAGELISSGTLTTPQPISAGDVWMAEVEGLGLPSLVLRMT